MSSRYVHTMTNCKNLNKLVTSQETHEALIHFMADTVIYTALMWTEANLEEMKEWMWPKRYPVGTALALEGHECDKLYLITRGEAASMIETGLGTSKRERADGRYA